MRVSHLLKLASLIVVTAVLLFGMVRNVHLSLKPESVCGRAIRLVADAVVLAMEWVVLSLAWGAL